MPVYKREDHVREHCENQFVLIKKMLETEMPKLPENLRFKTPFVEDTLYRQFWPIIDNCRALCNLTRVISMCM